LGDQPPPPRRHRPKCRHSKPSTGNPPYSVVSPGGNAFSTGSRKVCASTLMWVDSALASTGPGLDQPAVRRAVIAGPAWRAGSVAVARSRVGGPLHPLGCSLTPKCAWSAAGDQVGQHDVDPVDRLCAGFDQVVAVGGIDPAQVSALVLTVEGNVLGLYICWGTTPR
jgi:hypothetical protein